ncbi:MAG: class I SAM-dependent methyltransferase [Betaproteobacteria bacterium]|nr:MAG: class I SAM-dependent methyltransferase [Betaproteobacteria bacterium]
MLDLEVVKQKQQQTWATGDFAVIGWNTVYPGELLCEAVDLRAGHKILDVAAGSGNVALSAARRNCEAVGIDYVPALIERARLRAEAEGLPAKFEVADCEQIPFADESFDRVLSLYGSMFAPDQEKAARELIRVCRRGGLIGMGNWTPDGFWGQTFALVGRYLPPPTGVRPPPEWGTEKRLIELFGEATSSMHSARRSALFRFRDNQHWIDVFGTWFGPIMRVRENLDDGGYAEFLTELNGILDRFNQSDDDTLLVSADYLEVVIVK